MNNDFKITYKNKTYVIKLDLLLKIFSSLENRKIIALKNYEVLNELRKFNLLDDLFLKSISKNSRQYQTYQD